MEETINRVQMGDEFRVCPLCGYEDGFHSMLKKQDNGSLKWLFICPSCHRIFDIGYSVRFDPKIS